MKNRSNYSDDWELISLKIRIERAKNTCEECKAINGQPHPITGSKVVLTVAHLDHITSNNDESNLKALCQRCHFKHDREDNLRKRRQNGKV